MSNQVKQPVNFLCRLQQVTQNGKNAGERRPWKTTGHGRVTTNRLAMESIVEAQSEKPFCNENSETIKKIKSAMAPVQDLSEIYFSCYHRYRPSLSLHSKSISAP